MFKNIGIAILALVFSISASMAFETGEKVNVKRLCKTAHDWDLVVEASKTSKESGIQMFQALATGGECIEGNFVVLLVSKKFEIPDTFLFYPGSVWEATDLTGKTPAFLYLTNPGEGV